MATRPKVKGGFSRTGHRISEVDYSEDYLKCICGWEGRAIDKERGQEGYGDEKDYPTHRRTSPKVDINFENKYAGRYGTTIKPKKSPPRKYGHSPVPHGGIRKKEKVMV